MTRFASVHIALLHMSHVRVQKGSLWIWSIVQVGMLGDVFEETCALSGMGPSRRVSFIFVLAWSKHGRRVGSTPPRRVVSWKLELGVLLEVRGPRRPRWRDCAIGVAEGH